MKTASFETKDGEPLVLEGVKAQGRVVGRMLDMTLVQTYRNPTTTNVEVVYTFPLPWQAVLLGVEVELNGETLTGTVKAKDTARVEYEEALSEGDTGILVGLNADHSYTLELGNLMADERCVVRLHYVQVLQPEQGSLRLMLPTTLAPRYGDAVRDGGYEPHAAPVVSTTVEYPFDISLSVEGPLCKARIGSPTHSVAIQMLPGVTNGEDTRVDIRLASQSWLDRNFVLTFEGLAQSSLGIAALDQADEGMAVAMASFTPRLQTSRSEPVAMKVLVDCSGSMAGDSIQSARSALQHILASLKPEDRFSLSRFGTLVEHRSKALWKAAPAALAAARRWTEVLVADMGGTEMNDAILSTLSLRGSERCDVLLITDGHIHAIDAVIESAERSGHRFFVVGIGSEVSEGLLRRLAEKTGGGCEFVAPGEAVGPAIQRQFLRMRSPSLQGVRLEWPTGYSVLSQSELPISVFGGDDVVVYARMKQFAGAALSGKVRLLGQVQGEAAEACLVELELADISDEANTLARLAASQRYRQLTEAGEDSPAVLMKQLPALAEKYQLVTSDTSLVLVKRRSGEAKASDMPELWQARGMLPAGFGGHGTVMKMSVSTESASLRPALYRLRKPDAASSDRLASVWRYRSMASQKSGGLDDFEIPAFLRKDSDDAKITRAIRSLALAVAPGVPGVWQFPPKKLQYWSLGEEGRVGAAQEGVNYVGLTPAGLVEGLRINDSKLWPASYGELDSIGLGQRVIEWLELIVGEGLPQQVVVQAFLEVMSQMDFTFRQTASAILRKRSAAVHPPTLEAQQLKECIAKGLIGMEAKAWPMSVLNFVEAEQEALGS